MRLDKEKKIMFECHIKHEKFSKYLTAIYSGETLVARINRLGSLHTKISELDVRSRIYPNETLKNRLRETEQL